MSIIHIIAYSDYTLLPFSICFDPDHSSLRAIFTFRVNMNQDLSSLVTLTDEFIYLMLNFRMINRSESKSRPLPA